MIILVVLLNASCVFFYKDSTDVSGGNPIMLEYYVDQSHRDIDVMIVIYELAHEQEAVSI